MPRYAQLNNIDHQSLRVLHRYGERYGDAVATVPISPTEFADVQREYPIFFRKDRSTGEFRSLALLGFQDGENLFVESGRWTGAYQPGEIARGPFLIGFQDQHVDGQLRREPVIYVDLDHPRVSFTEGQALFLPQGGNSPYLEHVATVLRGIHEGVDVGRAMFAMFSELELIEPVKLEINLSDTEKFSLDGLYTISQEKLRALEGNGLQRLHSAGFLQGAYLVGASLANVRSMLATKQRRTAAQLNSVDAS